MIEGNNRLAELPRALAAHEWPADASPVVSVLIPAYNQERFIAQCLDSVLAQITDFPVEIIVHDDASTDRTVEIAGSYAEKHPSMVKLVLQKQNLHSQNRKVRPIMFGHAKGEFIANCDGDDFWLDPLKLAKQVAFLRQHPDCVLSFHDAVHVDANGNSLNVRELPDHARRDYLARDLRLLRWGWMLFGTVVQRNIPIEFPPEYYLVPNGDNFVPMLLGAFGGAHFHPEVGFLAYRQHSGGIWSMKPAPEKYAMSLRTYLQICSYFVRLGDFEAAREIILNSLRIFIGEYLSSHGNRRIDP